MIQDGFKIMLEKQQNYILIYIEFDKYIKY